MILKRLERLRYFPREIHSSRGGNLLIAERLGAHEPVAIGRIGATELNAILAFQQMEGGSFSPESLSLKQLHLNMGVFPLTKGVVSEFCFEYASAIASMDLLALYFSKGEAAMVSRMAREPVLVEPLALDPYFHPRPWSAVLAGNVVLVVHPFTESIEFQYEQREKIWEGRAAVLPAFELKTLKVPLSEALVKSPYGDWVEGLNDLRSRMSATAFDIAIVGAGAWGMPLVAHAKSMGKKAIYMGGGVQVLFGIKGARWDKNPDFLRYFNSFWRYPSESETPPGANAVEGGCYWKA